MERLFRQFEYEQRGYRKGASAKLKLNNSTVIIVSNPKIAQDNSVYVWVAMELDTYVRYKANIDNLELL